MQVNPADVLRSAPPTTAPTSVRVLAGDLAGIPVGALLQAVVTGVNPRDATARIDVNGQVLTVRGAVGLETGQVLFARVPKAPGTLELTEPPALPKPAAVVPTQPTEVKLVTVTETLPDGRVRAQIDGREVVATPTQALPKGEPLVLQVSRSPNGVTLGPPPQSDALPAQVAGAILRGTAGLELAPTLKPLQAELAALGESPRAGEVPVPARVREAAAVLRDTVQKLIPPDQQAPDADGLRNLVENGGLEFEAKLARLAEAGATREQVAGALKGDLKGDLLRLLHSAKELGDAVQLPAARAALGGIEAQQATQTFAQTTNTAYLLQVPFPDGDEWRTLHLALEREAQPDFGDPSEEGAAGRFRVLMHVPLSELGDTWVEASLSGPSFRATLYLDRPDVRTRVNAALPELSSELGGEGFREVLLAVRPADALPARAKAQSAAMAAGRPASTSLVDVRV